MSSYPNETTSQAVTFRLIYGVFTSRTFGLGLHAYDLHRFLLEKSFFPDGLGAGGARGDRLTGNVSHLGLSLKSLFLYL